MPRKNIDYSKTVIYKIVPKDLDLKYIYVGSTTDFTRRKCQHKCCCDKIGNKSYDLKVYTIIRDNGGWDKFEMIEIEKYPCIDKNEAEARERFWLETLNANLNMIIPTRTRKEYEDDNKEKIKMQKQEYRLANQDKIRIRSKQYEIDNKEAIRLRKKAYYLKNIDHNKQYYENNIDAIKLRKKLHYEKNKEKISEKNKVKVFCECGCSINCKKLLDHKKTLKHLNLMKLKENNSNVIDIINKV